MTPFRPALVLLGALGPGLVDIWLPTAIRTAHRSLLSSPPYASPGKVEVFTVVT